MVAATSMSNITSFIRAVRLTRRVIMSANHRDGRHLGQWNVEMGKVRLATPLSTSRAQGF
jgi:hypothetical protein